MIDIKSLMNSHDNKPRVETRGHKDKLAEVKQNERDIRDSNRKKREEEREYKKEAELAQSKILKMERSWDPTSKRAMKEAREEKKQERDQERKEVNDKVCEHGVHKCKICFPVNKHK